MKIVVLGLGETGYYLSQILLKEGHDLVLIDKNPAQIRRAKETLDAQIIEGNGANPLVLEPLIDETTDLFVAVTDSDEANIIATLVARRYGVKRAISRVSDTANLIHPLLTEDPKVSVLNPELIVSKDLVRLLGNPSADEIEFFANGKAEMMKLDVGPETKITGRKLSEIKIPRSWLVVAVIRANEFLIASGESVLQAGDHVLVMGDPRKSKEIEDLLGLEQVKVRRVILAGYNEISSRIAQNLVRRKIDVRLIEDNQEQASKASAALDGVLVIQGDATNEEILDQAGIDLCDYLIALTKDDESNVLLSLLAKEKGVQRAIALTQKTHYNRIIEKIGIDAVVNPRSAMVDDIIRCIHHEELSMINILEGGKGQMIEFILKRKTPAVDVPLSKLKLPKQSLVGAIIRGEELIIPRGDSRLKIGDHIVIFTTRPSLAEVKKFFAG